MKLERCRFVFGSCDGCFRSLGAIGARRCKRGGRANVERIQALRKERPGDGVLVFYQALMHVTLGERDAALELLRSLKGRKLGADSCARCRI